MILWVYGDPTFHSQDLLKLIRYMLTPCPETRPDIFQVSTLAFQLKGDPCPVQNLNVSTLYGTYKSLGLSLGFALYFWRTYQGFNLMKSLLHICRKSPYQSLATSPSILHHQSQIHLPHQQVIKSVTWKSSKVQGYSESLQLFIVKPVL